jgi:putative tryptophan/tyrosine transport system substrate-binding protein
VKRREFIAGLGSAAAWPLAAGAQQPVMPVVGFLHPTSLGLAFQAVTAFKRGLAVEGYDDGRNVIIEYRWAENRFDNLAALAVDLVQQKIAVLVTIGGTRVARAAAAATKTIPIVFSVGSDPVDAGLVASLARPGGNITGVTILTNELIAKRIELLHSVVPAAKLMALLTNAANPVVGEAEAKQAEQAASVIGLNLLVLKAGTPVDIEAAFAKLAQQHAGALVVSADAFFFAQRDQLAILAERFGLPAIYQDRTHVTAGGLMSYGTVLADAFRLVGIYTGRILKGDKPADLPVQQATKIELVLNMKTAKALGLTIPETLLATADEVIQ